MTGLEVWEAWKKNLSAKFKSNSNDRVMVIVNGIPRWEHNDKEVAIYSFMNHCWQPVKQPVPVTWQEAIQAWADGKKVSYSYMDGDLRFPFEDSNTMMRPEKIKHAKWFVED